MSETWNSLGEKAINSMDDWNKIFSQSDREIALKIMITSVTASGWAMGKTQQEIEAEAAKRLQEQLK